MKNIDKNQLRILAEDELRKCGVNPDYLEIMVTLVEKPDDSQKLAEEYYKLQMKSDLFEKRYKDKLREIEYLRRLVKALEFGIKANPDSKVESEMIN